MTSLIHSSLTNRILTLTISRPEVHNAFDGLCCDQLAEQLDFANADDAIRVIIITGSGTKAFSAGFDLSYAENNPQLYKDPLFASNIVRRPAGQKPLIAAVNGLAMGLGFELALACDLIIASKQATFALPEPMVGLAAMGGGVARLSRTIGAKQALGISLTGRSVSAEEGLTLGFVNEVTEAPVVDAALRWAEQISRCGPLSIKATQEIAARSVEMDLAASLDPHNYPSVMQLLDSEDAQEGRKAFLERRQPVWKNR